MPEFPQYDITQPAKDPDDMTDEELDWTIAVLKEDWDESRRRADSLKEDIKKRRNLFIVYRSFREVREEGGLSDPPYVRRYATWNLYQCVIPWLAPGIYDIWPCWSLQVHPDPPQRYQQRWFQDVASWMFGRGGYKH